MQGIPRHALHVMCAHAYDSQHVMSTRIGDFFTIHDGNLLFAVLLLDIYIITYFIIIKYKSLKNISRISWGLEYTNTFVVLRHIMKILLGFPRITFPSVLI